MTLGTSPDDLIQFKGEVHIHSNLYAEGELSRPTAAIPMENPYSCSRPFGESLTVAVSY